MNSANSYNFSKQTLLYFVVLGILFPVIYFQLFSAGFISWDDGEVLLKNKDVHQFSLKAFFTNYYVGNYAPLTMISFAIDWALFHGNAIAHHSVNMALHFINGLLVFYISQQLLKNKWLSLLCTIIFYFHPLQIETIAWVSAKNNLLSANFILFSFIFYLKYSATHIKKYYAYTFLFFVLACLSKPSAIAFPVCLMAFDTIYKREISFKVISKHWPLIIISVVFGLVTLYTRNEDQFINQNHAFPIYERIGYAGYAILHYLYTFLVPVNLSVIYPYPSNKWLSIIAGYILFALLIFACLKLYKSKKTTVLFGVLFFVSHLLLVLQFIPFGQTLTADRYMYLPIIGLSWVLCSIISLKELHLKFISVILLLSLGALSYLRSATWKNSLTLYRDILTTYPHSYEALGSLGAEYLLQKNYDMALQYLNQAVNENTSYYKSYYNRGLVYAQLNRMKDALNDFTKAIELNRYPKAYVARANVYYALNDYSRSITDVQTVLKTEPSNVKAIYTLANCYDNLNQLDNALPYYNKAISINPEEPSYYLRRGVLSGKKQQFQLCITDLNKCLNLDPTYAEAYYWKGVAQFNLKQNPCASFKKALELGFVAAQQPLEDYCR